MSNVNVVFEGLEDAIQRNGAEMKRLRELNAELLGALKRLMLAAGRAPACEVDDEFIYALMDAKEKIAQADAEERDE